MSLLFEEFSKMAEQEYGLTVIKKDKPSSSLSLFESLFGISISEIEQYTVPFDIKEDFD